MKLIQKLAASSLAIALAASLGACGGSNNVASTPASSTPQSSAPQASAPAQDTITIKVGASPAPHAEILENIKPLLAKDNINLEIVEFTDYVIPNQALDAQEIDANYFPHLPYLNDFNEKNGMELVSAAAIHFEPLGIYPGKTTAIDAIPDGATIAVPNDATNEARALLLLQAQGLIKLSDGIGLQATPLDIVENPKNLKIQEMEAAQLPNVLTDVDLAVINGNYAVGAGIADKVLVTEEKESEAAQEFANIIAVKKGDETRPEIQKLVEALSSQENATFIQESYSGTVIPVF